MYGSEIKLALTLKRVRISNYEAKIFVQEKNRECKSIDQNAEFKSACFSVMQNRPIMESDSIMQLHVPRNFFNIANI